MHHEDALVSALIGALENDRSPEALHRAVTALRAARGVSTSRAYAILVRATAGLPIEPITPASSAPSLSMAPPSQVLAS